MKKLSLLATLASLGMASTALAADLPARKVAPAAPVVPAFTWSGFYVGLNAGYGGDSFNYPIGVNVPAASAPGPFGGGNLGANVGLNSSGWLGGAQIGYNYQMGAFVVGAEADFAFANIEGKMNANINAANNAGNASVNLGGSIGSTIQNVGTVRLRVGYAWDRVLFYATGGWAYGNVQTSVSGDIGVLGQAAGFGFSKTNMQNGWTLGAGVEYAFTNNITFKTEYLYVDLGNSTVYSATYTQPGINGISANWGVETTAQIVRVGLNYKF